MSLALLLRGYRRTGERALLDQVLLHAREDGAGRHVRSARGRLPPLLGGRALAGAALREDAVRQRSAHSPLRSRPFSSIGGSCGTASSSRPSATSAREMTSAHGGFLLGAGRRQRGRGGPLLRLATGARSTRRWATPVTPASSRPTSPSAREATSSTARRYSRPLPTRRPSRRRRSPPRGSAPRLAAGRRRLLEVRAQRVAPERDDKVLAGWNGLMVRRPGLRVAGVLAARLGHGGAARGRLRPLVHATARRPTAALVPGRVSPPRGAARRLRQPRARPRVALPGHLRAQVPRGGRRAGRGRLPALLGHPTARLPRGVQGPDGSAGADVRPP